MFWIDLLMRPTLLRLAFAWVLTCWMALAQAQAPAAQGLTLHLAHINDHHSMLDERPRTEMRLLGEPAQVSLGGFARVAQAMRELSQQHRPLLKLHAGDAMTGSLYYTLFKGSSDAQLMNTVCFDAFVPGNHEFDDGDANLRDFLDELARGPCQTAVISANVQAAPNTPLAGRLQPWVIREIEGVRVGLIGITVAGKTRESSRPLPSTRFDDERASAQRSIDALKAQGVRHIVLITHHGHDRDLALAAQLNEVDVIIGGDSHTLLGDTAPLGLASAGPYPTIVRNRDGDPVCIGQAWEYAKAIGHMQVRFDTQGRVRECGGQAQLLIGADVARRQSDGRWQVLAPAAQLALAQELARTQAPVRISEPNAQAQAMLAGFTERLEAMKRQPVGRLREALCLVRVPGERVRGVPMSGCEQAHQLARGSDAAQLVAQAFLEAAPRADIAIQNAGGVRTAVPAGELSMHAAIAMLPFANVLVEIELTGSELKAALEDAVLHHLDRKGSDGAHPYAAGLRWDLDLRQSAGQRFSNLQVRDRQSGQWLALRPEQRYVLVTIDFLASGRDGYATLGRLSEAGRANNTYLLYTQALIDHLKRHPELGRPARADYAHQRVIDAQGQVLGE